MDIFEKYLMVEAKTEKVDYVKNGKILQTTTVIRVSNRTIKHKDKIIDGYFEDSNGNRYSYDQSMNGYHYYTIM